MKKIKLKHIINTAIIGWTIIWIYYLVFNWNAFTISLNTNLGFAVINAYPLVFFFILGLLFFVLLKYFEQSAAIRKERKEKDMKNQISLLEKDLEVLKLKEDLYKMQSDKMSISSENMIALHRRLDEISSEMERHREKKEKNDTGEENKDDDEKPGKGKE